MNREEVKYLSCAETAKLVRAELKKQLPAFKFSVRSNTYAGGASVNVTWEDGLPESAVEKVVDKFSGAWFDGMIDLKNYNYHWLLANGSVLLAHSEGTEDDITTEKLAGAIAVQFGADYIRCNRHLTEDLQRRIAEDIGKIGELKFNGSMDQGFEYPYLYADEDKPQMRWFDWWIFCGRVSSTGNLDNYKGVKLVNGAYELI
jgi:hypothetical protein